VTIVHRPAKLPGMASTLRTTTRKFVHGELPLEALREAARREFTNRRMADEILKLISEWENGTSPDSAWARSALRDRVEDLLPSIPEPSKKRDGASAAAAMYEAGLRGNLRRE
jgi:hypothetical protein